MDLSDPELEVSGGAFLNKVMKFRVHNILENSWEDEALAACQG
jgi:hypothetical protein